MIIKRFNQKFSFISYILFSITFISRIIIGQEEKQHISIEDFTERPTFIGEYFSGGEWDKKGSKITFIQFDRTALTTNLLKYDLESGDTTKIIDGSNLYADDVERNILIEDYSYHNSGDQILIFTDTAPVWRDNTQGFYYIYDIESKKLTNISSRDKGYQLFAKFSPDGKYVAFVRDRNIFMVELKTMKETQFTNDGSENGIINGTTDWVYEEEFSLRDGFSWSPDNKYIAFYKLDETRTSTFQMLNLLNLKPIMREFKFPLVGEENSLIKVGTIKIENGDINFFDTGTWNNDDREYEYLPRMGWTPDVNGNYYVWMIRLNRDQNHLDLLYGNPESMNVEVILEEEEETWVEVSTFLSRGEKLTYLNNEKHFVFSSEIDGFNHLYLYKNNGDFVKQITNGEWCVTEFYGYDDVNDYVYFSSNKKSVPESHLYRIKLFSGDNHPERITTEKGTHAISMSTDFNFFTDTYSNRNTPPVTTLKNSDGQLLKTLTSNEELIERLKSFNFPNVEFTMLPSAETGLELYGYMMKPNDFDPEKKYPLLIYTYGGPAAQEVTDSWGGFFSIWHAYLVNEYNILVVCVDNRGSLGRGKKFATTLYKKLGTVEPQDQIAAAKYFGSLAYIDESRIGIWGWSYGGYNTINSMLKYDGPQTFKVGIAVAGGSDFRYYNTIYTERYMSTPQENPEGYEEAAAQNFASNLADNQKLLLIHGDMDDNSHYIGTVKMISELQKAKKQFEMMVYPGGDHGMRGTGNPFVYTHLFTTMTNYLIDNL
ncbi:MAG: S9 family peptidase [Ignavibacteria bacterium]|jgi:dipeptidyl-peptidase-4